MSIPAITYAEIINIVRTFIKTNCLNWTDNGSFDNIPACFKSKWKSNWILFSGDGTNDRSSWYRNSLVYNPVASTNYNILESNITSFLSQINLTGDKLNNNVAASEFINFLNNISSFCSSNCVYTNSTHNTNATYNNFMIYVPSTTFSRLQQINTNNSEKIITAADANLVLNNVTEVIKQSIRTRNCIYTVNFTEAI